MHKAALEELVERVRRPIDVDLDETYYQIGIRSHGRGIFFKDPVSGRELGTKKVFWVERGDLIFNIVFAWEGATAVLGPTPRRLCGSHRFPTYRARAGVADVSYLELFLQSTAGRSLLELASPGSAGRNRTLNQGLLLSMLVPAPPLQQQLRLVNLIEAFDTTTATARRMAASLEDTIDAHMSRHVGEMSGREAELRSLLELSIGGVWGSEPGSADVDVRVVRATEFDNSGVLRSGGVTRSISRAQLASRQLRPDDILLEKSGGGPKQPVGRVVWVDGFDAPTVSANFVQLVRPNGTLINPRYLFHRMWIWHRQGRTLEYQSNTTGIRNLRTQDYLAQLMIIPSRDVQDEFVATADALMEAERRVHIFIESLLKSRTALLLNYFNGDREIPDQYDDLLKAS